MGFIYYDPVHFHSTEICSLKFRTKENLISDNSDKSGSIKTFNVRQIQSIYEIRSIETAILNILSLNISEKMPIFATPMLCRDRNILC